MNREKKRRRQHRTPILFEENLTINSRSTTTSTQRHEDQHIENRRRQWFDYSTEEEGEGEEPETIDDLPFQTLSSDETIAEKIDRVLKKINAWTNERTTNPNHQALQHEISFNKPSYNYDNLFPGSFSLSKSSRRRSSSSTHLNSNHRANSMTFMAHRSPRKTSMYGSDFFFNSAPGNEHEYDNITYPSHRSRYDRTHDHHPPFPSVILDCQRCHHSVDRSSFHDRSCQVPSDIDELYQDVQYEHHSTPLYRSPRSSICQMKSIRPPSAKTLLAAYHSRSKSVPSSTSSSISSEKIINRTRPSATVAVDEPSTNTLLRSIKTSIHAMKKRLKDIRRFSEVCQWRECAAEEERKTKKKP